MVRQLNRLYLHSNMFLLRRSCGVDNKDGWLAFTFQYVSIKTGPQGIQGVQGPKFTFQYVSIKTACDCFCTCAISDLHSNMFLLRQRRSGR